LTASAWRDQSDVAGLATSLARRQHPAAELALSVKSPEKTVRGPGGGKPLCSALDKSVFATSDLKALKVRQATSLETAAQHGRQR
jgi:hypothetical protein